MAPLLPIVAIVLLVIGVINANLALVMLSQVIRQDVPQERNNSVLMS